MPYILVLKSKGLSDKDDDGIVDDRDKCPNVKGYANLGGCLDSDMMVL